MKVSESLFWQGRVKYTIFIKTLIDIALTIFIISQNRLLFHYSDVLEVRISTTNSF